MATRLRAWPASNCRNLSTAACWATRLPRGKRWPMAWGRSCRPRHACARHPRPAGQPMAAAARGPGRPLPRRATGRAGCGVDGPGPACALGCAAKRIEPALCRQAAVARGLERPGHPHRLPARHAGAGHGGRRCGAANSGARLRPAPAPATRRLAQPAPALAVEVRLVGKTVGQRQIETAQGRVRGRAAPGCGPGARAAAAPPACSPPGVAPPAPSARGARRIRPPPRQSVHGPRTRPGGPAATTVGHAGLHRRAPAGLKDRAALQAPTRPIRRPARPTAAGSPSHRDPSARAGRARARPDRPERVARWWPPPGQRRWHGRPRPPCGTTGRPGQSVRTGRHVRTRGRRAAGSATLRHGRASAGAGPARSARDGARVGQACPQSSTARSQTPPRCDARSI